MADQAAEAFVTVDIVIPRLSPSGSGWEVALIQRKKQPYQGAWALPGGASEHRGCIVRSCCST